MPAVCYPHGMPRAMVIGAGALFAVCAVGTLVYVSSIVFGDITEFWRRSDLGSVSRTLAALLLGLAASSGLLYLHARGQESYATLAEIFFLACFGISACNLLWVVPVASFS